MGTQGDGVALGEALGMAEAEAEGDEVVLGEALGVNDADGDGLGAVPL